MSRRTRLAYLIVAAMILAAGCGHANRSATAAASTTTSSTAPCPAPGDPIRAAAVTGEHLQAGGLPDGVRLTAGSEDDPAFVLEYSQPDDASRPRFDVFRHFTTQPAAAMISAGKTDPVMVHGRPGVAGRSNPASGFILVAWHELDDVVVSISAANADRATALRVADATRYDQGQPGPNSPGPAPGAPARCRTLPPDAKSRQDILNSAAPRPGITAQAKLVRLTDLDQALPGEVDCTTWRCPDHLAVWVLLQTGPPGSFPHSGPAGAPPEALAGSWALSVHDAATGRSRLSSIGGGTPPAYWDRLQDLAPEP